MVVEVNQDNFDKEVLEESKTVLVDFNADWCGPCQMLKPILEEISNEITDCKFVSINCDDNFELSQKYDVKSIPCLILIKNGQEEKRMVGLRSKSELMELLGE